MNTDLIGLTASLVAAYLRGNPMPAGQLSDFIRSTHSALASVTAPQPQPVSAQQPAVSVRKSVRPHAIACLECGKEQKMLKRHLNTAHGLTVEDYKAKWSLPGDYPMTAPDYASTRSDLAKRIGLGRKPAQALENEPSESGERDKTPSAQKYPASRWSKPTK